VLQQLANNVGWCTCFHGESTLLAISIEVHAILLSSCFLVLLRLLQMLLIPNAHDVGCFAPNVSYTGCGSLLFSAAFAQ
jgi:hypothetical protein